MFLSETTHDIPLCYPLLPHASQGKLKGVQSATFHCTSTADLVISLCSKASIAGYFRWNIVADAAVVCLGFFHWKKCALLARAFLFEKNISPNI